MRFCERVERAAAAKLTTIFLRQSVIMTAFLPATLHESCGVIASIKLKFRNIE